MLDNRAPIDHDALVIQWPSNLLVTLLVTLNIGAGYLGSLRSFSLTYFTGTIHLPVFPLHQLTTLYNDSHVIFFFSNTPAMLETLRQCVSLVKLVPKFPLSQPNFPLLKIWKKKQVYRATPIMYKAMQRLKMFWRV